MLAEKDRDILSAAEIMNYYSEDSWAQEEAEARAEYERTFHLIDELKQENSDLKQENSDIKQKNFELDQKYSDIEQKYFDLEQEFSNQREKDAALIEELQRKLSQMENQ